MDAQKPQAAPEIAARVAQVVAGFRPYIQSHGGDIELLGVDADGCVRVRLRGACVGCPASMMTLQMGLEQELRASVSQFREVVNVP